MQITLLNIHSFIDIITNSSSEIFVCNVKKEVEEVKTLLKELFEQWNKNTIAERQANVEASRAKYDPTGEKGYYTKDAELYKFDNCFGNIYKITDKNVKQFIDELVLGWQLYPPGFKRAKIGTIPDYFTVEEEVKNSNDWDSLFLYPYKENEKENEQRRDLLEKAFLGAQQNWLDQYGEKARKILIGKIVIESKGDNTIPYEFFQEIEKTFKGISWHLG